MLTVLAETCQPQSTSKGATMQFYENGYFPGDPEIAPGDIAPRGGGDLPDRVDVLIVGTGPAGLVLAAQLSRFADLDVRIVERRDGPLQLGQADGIACRSVEMFEAFGLSERLLREAYWVNDTVFWGPSADPARIERKGRVQDVEDGLSEFPHVIVNQARIQQYLLEVMERSASRLRPDYGLEVIDVTRDDDPEYPVEVTMVRVGADGADETVGVRARYVVGCDGARSVVRRAIGQSLEGDAARQLWGVMDVLAVTDLPDIRFKLVIQSTEGNSVVIPREGGYLVRFYIELGELAEGERAADRGVTLQTLVTAANRILHPYTLDVRDCPWWSAYEIGQRLTRRFDDGEAEHGEREPRVFIAGDACHTHSPKAGQGMNVSMQDAFNLGWKLAAVLRGTADPSLLATYSAERQVVAGTLIEFDKKWAKIVSAPTTGRDAVTPAELQAAFVEQGRYTAGVATRYVPSMITGGADHQNLATGFPVGERFHSSPVTRIGDGRLRELGHAARADGRWRLYLFGDAEDPRSPHSRLRTLCEYLLHDPASPITRHTQPGADFDDTVDVRAVLQQGYADIGIPDLPWLLAPRKGRFDLIDYEKAFSSRVRDAEEIFEARGVDRGGAMVVVRPDQYVAAVLPLDAHVDLGVFFDGFLVSTAERGLRVRS
jgi:phenol 2-monooxygenase